MNSLGMLLEQMGDLDGAIESFRRGVELGSAAAPDLMKRVQQKRKAQRRGRWGVDEADRDEANR